MSKPAISIQGLGKRYLLGSGGGERYRALRDVIVNSVTSIWDRSKRGNSLQEFWALKDFELKVNEGETVGIIGRNGAGKSTLLKLLSRITEPTTGEIILRGRVASLLEVGTGFHPELTGKENIYMNGSILGMKRAEIKRKYDEIVAFAEIEQFLDTPVKRYSSGMYVRLAFAVAAHLEPELLLVDEVLAVGDAKFQKKCLSKMDEVSKRGKTILVVSHNMPLVINLCQRAILLNGGKKVFDGKARAVVEHYLSTARASNGEVVWPDLSNGLGNDVVRLHSVRILQDGVDGPTADVDISKEIQVQITYRNLKEGVQLYSGIFLTSNLGVDVFASSNASSVCLMDDDWYKKPRPIGVFQATCLIPPNLLNEGRYSITAIVGIAPATTQIMEKDVLSFDVHDTGEMRKEFYGGWLGVVRPKLAWHTAFISSEAKHT